MVSTSRYQRRLWIEMTPSAWARMRDGNMSMYPGNVWRGVWNNFQAIPWFRGPGSPPLNFNRSEKTPFISYG